MAGRTYLQWRQGLSWHAVDESTGYAQCGAIRPLLRRPTRDRIPPDGRYCGRCGRIVGARTDIEEHA